MKKILRYIGIIFIILVFAIQLLTESSGNDNYEARYDIEYSSPHCAEEQLIQDGGITSSRSWRDYNRTDFCTAYETTNESYLHSVRARNSMVANLGLTQNRYWKDIYNYLYYTDFDKLKPLADSLWAISEAKGLDRNEFANMVVSFVQDIPYAFILGEEDCSTHDPGFDCLNNQRFGLLSPVEFLYTLKGDCDTRTVLLYALFKHFNYSPIIVNSWKYLHSMLLLDVATSGKYLEHNGQYFYFWETTAKGWQAGDVPPDMTDLTSWQIIMD